MIRARVPDRVRPLLLATAGSRSEPEGFFRDDESVRNGLARRRTQVKKADRFDRLVPVLAYLLLTGLGLRALAECRTGWSSPDKRTP